MSSPRVGQMVNPSLRLLRPLGAGGMGSVWIARHLGLDTNVVVKFISAELAENPQALERFRREAAAAAEVRSPHVVQTFDYGLSADGLPYIAMELLEGMSLRQRLDRDVRLGASDVVAVIGQCCKALGRAHEKGVVHRDIKPDNVFLTDVGGGEIFAKVLDFGIAKARAGDMVATSTGAVLGSPYYMSPEQVVGSKHLDHRTDLWSLGVMTFEMVTGRRPFDGETIGALSIAICHGELPVPSRVAPGLPASFDAWFARACARNAAERFGTAKELADGLAAALAGDGRAVGAPLGHTTPMTAFGGLPRGGSIAHVGFATLPMSTTGGLGVVVSPAPPRRDPRLLAGLAALVVLSTATSVWLAWPSSKAAGETGAESTAAEPEPPKKRIAPKAQALKEQAPTEPIEVAPLVGSAQASASAAASSSSAPTGAAPVVVGPTATAASPSKPKTSATAAAKPTASTTTTAKPGPIHDTNIF